MVCVEPPERLHDPLMSRWQACGGRPYSCYIARGGDISNAKTAITGASHYIDFADYRRRELVEPQ